ncbi:NAD(P)/FAD-dependent oxidoreductase [Granulicatella sp.]
MRIAIIGAGIVGATAAYQLSKNSEVKLVVYDDGIGQATKAAAGIICPWLSQRRNKDWYRLTARGASYYPELMAELEEDGVTQLPYEQVGALIFKKTPELLEKLEKIAAERREGEERIGTLTKVEEESISSYVPGWNGTHGAIHCSGGGRVDGKLLVEQQLFLAKQNGASIQQEKVSLTRDEEGKVVVKTNDGLEQFDKIIVASGAWVKELIEPLGYYVDVRPQKGQLIELELQTIEPTDDWPVCMLHGEIDILPFEDGKIIVGATHENDQGFDLTDNQELQQKMYEEACEVFPPLKEAKWLGSRIGTRAYTSDFLPFFGNVPGEETLFVASGLGSSGLTSGVWIGALLAQLSAGDTPLFNVDSYTPGNYIQKII